VDGKGVMSRVKLDFEAASEKKGPPEARTSSVQRRVGVVLIVLHVVAQFVALVFSGAF
jgi:hypothetical protein